MATMQQMHHRYALVMVHVSLWIIVSAIQATLDLIVQHLYALELLQQIAMYAQVMEIAPLQMSVSVMQITMAHSVHCINAFLYGTMTQQQYVAVMEAA